MEDFSKELGIVEKYLLRGEYPVGMTKADKANLRRKCRNNFKTEDGVLYYRKNVETGDKQEDSLWRICVRTCEDKMRILESCHAGLAGNEMMERCVLEQISDVSARVCVCG